MLACVVRRGLLLGVVMTLAGCASMRHQEALYKEAHQHVYPRPIEEVWPEVVRFVSDEGYPPRKGNQEFILLTDWRTDLQESRVVSTAARLYVEGRRIDRDRSMVRIFKQTVFTGNKGAVSARENRVIGSMMVGAAGDVSPFAEDPVKLSHLQDSTPDHTPFTRAPAQMSRSVDRDGELEWKLLQRLDAAAAQALEARINAREKP